MKREAYVGRIETVRVQDASEHDLRARVRAMGGNAEIEAWIVALVRGLADWEAVSESSDRETAALRAQLEAQLARRSA